MKPCITATRHIVSPQDVPKEFSAKLRRADDFIRLGVAATAQVYPVQEELRSPPDRTGIIIGTAFGPMQTNFDVLGLIVDEDQTSPTLFSHSVFNSAAGYIARLFNIPGSCFTFTDFAWPFFQALAEGFHALDSGRLDHCLILQIESYSDLLLDALQRTGTNNNEWPMGAIAWYLSTNRDATGQRIEHINIQPMPATPRDLLQRKEEIQLGSEKIFCPTPLAAAEAVTSLIQQPREETSLCTVKAPYGSVSLTLAP